MPRRRTNTTTTTTETITLEGEEIAYKLVRSNRRRRTMSLSFDPELGGLRMLVPKLTPMSEIERFMQSRPQWIRDVRQRLADAGRAPDWDNGETIYLRGNPIKVVLDRLPQSDRRKSAVPQRSLDGAELRIFLPASQNGARRDVAVADAISHWYRQEAATHLPARLEAWLPLWRSALEKLGIYNPQTDNIPPKVRITHARKRWGSVGMRLVRGETDVHRVINLAWRLMRVPDNLADYAIVHELAHLKEMNHQSAFWRLVWTMLPDWRERRAELGKWGRDPHGD